MKALRRKGQGSVEFIIIAGALIFIFIGMTLVIQNRMGDAYKSRLYASLEELSNVVGTEIRLAASAEGDYIRRFYLPPDIEGYNYTLTVNANQEVVIRSEEIDYVLFFDKNITGTIDKGWNLINKTGDNITLSVVP